MIPLAAAVVPTLVVENEKERRRSEVERKRERKRERESGVRRRWKPAGVTLKPARGSGDVSGGRATLTERIARAAGGKIGKIVSLSK